MKMAVSEKSWLSATTHSYHEPRLIEARRSSSSRRRASILDFDLSRLQHSREQRDSYPSIETASIVPLPADNVKNRTERRVVFNLEHAPEVTDKKSSLLDSIFPLKVNSEEILADAVKYSLEQKDRLFEDFYSFIQCEEFTESESTFVIGRYDFDYSLEMQDDPKSYSAGLEGRLQTLGATEIYVHKLMSKKALNSLNPSFGGSEPCITAEDIWPWPWLNSEIRAKSEYKSAAYNRVTFSNQHSLPNIPLPNLAYSLKSYLQSIKPCVHPHMFSNTVKTIYNFAKEEARLYHECLVRATDVTRDSWIREFLPNYSHCYSRQEAPMINTGIVAPFMYDLWPEKPGTQAGRAAILIELAVEFWQLLRDERLLPVSVSKDGMPSCMHGFRKLFSSVKLPGIPRDEIFYCFSSDSEYNTPRHIIIFYKGQIFSLDVLTTCYVRVSSDEIKRRLTNIMSCVDEETCEAGSKVGILTSLNRNSWSGLRVHLMELTTDNQGSLNEIERAIFVLSLDHTTGSGMDRLLRDAIFGCGSNRWYDKSLNFNVTRNGLVTVNSNTSIIEGSTVAFLLNYIHLRIMEDAEKWDDDVLISISASAMDATRASSRMDDLLTRISSHVSLMADMASLGQKLKSIREATSNSQTNIHEEPKIIPFELDDRLRSAIEDAKANFLDLSKSLNTAVCRFEKYENNLFKDKPINKDAFAHIVLQLTFFRMYYRPPSMGSRVSLRRFHYGRYDILRSTTCEVVDWCKVMLDADSTFENRVSLFLKAMERHVYLFKNVFNGRGCENHLASLRVIAEDVYNTTPKLFQDEGVRMAGAYGHFDIYAEGLGTECTSCAVVWPTSLVGYGVGYFVANSKIVFNITSWSGEKKTSAELFAFGIDHTLTEMYAILKSL